MNQINILKGNTPQSEIKFSHYIITLIIFFTYIFGPVLNKFGAWVDFIFIFSILIFVLNITKIRQVNRSLYYYFYILILFYLILSIKILSYPKLTFLIWLMNFIKPFRILFTLFAGYFLAKNLFNKKYTFYDIIQLIFFVIILHSSIIIIQFFNKDFRDLIYSYTTTGEFRSSFEYDFRMGGLTGGSGGAILSIVQSLGIILIPFLFKLNNARIFRLLIFVASLIIVLSIILTGRSGIYCIIIFLPFSIFLVYGMVKTLKYTFFIFALSIFAFLLLNQLLLFFDLTEFYNSFYRTFDSFISFSETGKYENETVLILKDYILIPDLNTLLFGSNDALLNYDVDRNLDSDIGYVRNIFSFGLFGFILYILPFILLLYYAKKNIKKSLSYKLLFLLLIIMAFFHAKESLLYVRIFWSIICLIIGFILAENNDYKSKKVCVV